MLSPTILIILLFFGGEFISGVQAKNSTSNGGRKERCPEKPRYDKKCLQNGPWLLESLASIIHNQDLKKFKKTIDSDFKFTYCDDRVYDYSDALKLVMEIIPKQQAVLFEKTMISPISKGLIELSTYIYGPLIETLFGPQSIKLDMQFNTSSRKLEAMKPNCSDY